MSVRGGIKELGRDEDVAEAVRTYGFTHQVLIDDLSSVRV